MQRLWVRVHPPRGDGENRARSEERKLFGLERRGRVAKSGNSLVIRIPREIAESLKIKRDSPIVIYPTEPRKLIVEVEG